MRPCLLLVFVFTGCGDHSAQNVARRLSAVADYSYPGGLSIGCDAATRNGRSGHSDDQRTANDVHFNVITPRNYDSRYRHPLLLVFAPAHATRLASEQRSRLTEPATRAGFVVTYADHLPLSEAGARELATIPRIVSENWCIDENRIFYAGHSDGGTVSEVLAVLPDTRGRVRAIAPIAAGVTEQDLAAYGCPSPLAVLVRHSAADTLFPGWGERSVKWWAHCNRCDTARKRRSRDGCSEFQGCAARGRTLYCEGNEEHATWPGNAATIINFFASIGSE